MRLKEFGADFVADFSDVSVWLEMGDFEGEFAGEGVAVGVESGGGKGEERVAGFYIFAGENIFAFDDADNEAREIVFTHRIEAGHLGGFAAYQGAACFAAGAAHAVDELLDDVRF